MDEINIEYDAAISLELVSEFWVSFVYSYWYRVYTIYYNPQSYFFYFLIIHLCFEFFESFIKSTQLYFDKSESFINSNIYLSFFEKWGPISFFKINDTSSIREWKTRVSIDTNWRIVAYFMAFFWSLLFYACNP